MLGVQLINQEDQEDQELHRAKAKTRYHLLRMRHHIVNAENVARCRLGQGLTKSFDDDLGLFVR